MNGWQDRPYQNEAHDAVFREFDDAGHMSTLVNMATGTGKTRVATKIATTVVKDYERPVLFLAHRGILVRQAERALGSCDLKVAVEMAGEDAMAGDKAEVVVGSVQSLQGERLKRWHRNHFGLVISDEAHHGHAAGHQAIYDHFKFARHLGITATPEASKRSIFASEAYRYTLLQAVRDGWLCKPYREKCKVSIDLRDLKMQGNDFNLGELGARVSAATEYIASASAQRIGGRKTVAFTPDVGSAQALAAALSTPTATKHAISARYVAGEGGRFGMPRAQREKNLADFANNEYQVIVCCELLFEGWDCPDVECVVNARPTAQLYRYKQMLGRGTRISPETGKEDCVFVDFDWKTNEKSRDLVTWIDFIAAEDEAFAALDGEAKEKVIARAKKLEAKGESPEDALGEAKEYIKTNKSVPIFMQGVQAKFDVEIHDPLMVGDIMGMKRANWDFMKDNRYPPATEAQKHRLKLEGFTNVDNMTKFGAARYISEIERRRKNGSATVRQMITLRKLGIGEITARSMTKNQASDTIERLSREFTEKSA